MMDQAGFCSSGRSSRSTLFSRERADPKPLAPLARQQVCVLNAVLTAGLYDSVGRILYTPSVDVLDRVACSVETAQGKAQVHPSSVNRNLQTHGWLLFQEKVGVCLWGWGGVGCTLKCTFKCTLFTEGVF